MLTSRYSSVLSRFFNARPKLYNYSSGGQLQYELKGRKKILKNLKIIREFNVSGKSIVKENIVFR